MWNWQKMSCFWMNIVMLHPKIHYIFNCWESGLLNWWKFPTVIFNFSRLLPRNFKYGFRLCWMDTRLCQTIYGMWYVWWPRISGINAHHILFFHNKNCDNFVYVSIMFSCFLFQKIRKIDLMCQTRLSRNLSIVYTKSIKFW